MRLETLKERNGWKSTTVPDLKTTNVFLFEDEPDDAQGHYVIDIFDNNYGSIIVCYIPEWTPVANNSAYAYGTKKIRIKP